MTISQKAVQTFLEKDNPNFIFVDCPKFLSQFGQSTKFYLFPHPQPIITTPDKLTVIIKILYRCRGTTNPFCRDSQQQWIAEYLDQIRQTLIKNCVLIKMTELMARTNRLESFITMRVK